MVKEILSYRPVQVALVLVVIIGISGVLYLQSVKREAARDIQSLEETAKPQQPPPAGPADTSDPSTQTTQGGHFHADGTFHAEPHSTAEPLKPPPGAVVTPVFPKPDPNEDPVEAAYKRLDYIKNNPYAWGGVYSPRATELIAQLMPPPVLQDEGHGDVVEEQIDELIAQGDPRAAEVLIANIYEGYISGHPMFDALVEIGPPTLPYLIPYLREDNVSAVSAVSVSGRIAAQYRDELGGIVEHLIIPKLEIILTSENFGPGTKEITREALAQLGR